MVFSILAAYALPTVSGLDPSFERPGVDDSAPDRDTRFDTSATSDSVQVVGGVRESQYGATVALYFPQMGAFCSASMITPRVALTAAHCVNEQGITPGLVEQYGQVHWGPRADRPTQTAAIVRAIPHPGYGLTGAGIPVNDLALIEIEPVEYTDTVWINERDMTDAYLGATFFSVGFGVNENGDNSSGVKRSASVTLDSFMSDFLVSDADTNPRRANVCSGDSGGPMYGIDSEGRFLQYAVHSWSDVGSGCRGLAGSTSTANFSTFILNNVERIHGSDDMCENRGANTDVVCDPECPDDVICAAFEAGEAKACQTGSTGSFWLFGLVLAALGRRPR